MKRCKTCGNKIEHFVMDYENGTINCFNCRNELPKEMFFTNSTVNQIAKDIPENERDKFLDKLGFEKRPIRRTSKFSLAFIITIAAISIVIAFFMEFETVYYKLLAVGGGVAFLFQILRYYKEEEIPKYKRKKAWLCLSCGRKLRCAAFPPVKATLFELS